MTSVRKITLNIPVEDASKSAKLLSRIVDCETLIADGKKYALLSIAGVRVAFVSGAEDISGGRVAVALEVESVDTVSGDAERAGAHVRRADHPSSRDFYVASLPGSADLIYYEK